MWRNQMKSIRQLCSAAVLTLMLGLPALAGDIDSPGKAACGDIGSPGIATYGDMGNPGKAGGIQTGIAEDIQNGIFTFLFSLF